MRPALAVIALALASSAAARADEPPVPVGKTVNPEYATWSRFPVGTITTVKYEGEGKSYGPKDKAKWYTATTSTLESVTADQVELRVVKWEEYKLNGEPDVRKVEHKPAKLVHPRFATRPAPDTSKVVDTYEKEILVNGKTVKARFTKTEEGGFDAEDSTLIIERWTSDEVPGGLVQEDKEMFSSTPSKTRTELTTFVKPGEWQPLFNGKNIDDWRANNDSAWFSVRWGILRVQASDKTATHLFYVGDRKEGFEKFKNFELEATVKSEPDANSGIFVHTAMTANAKGHLDKGYEVQLNSTEKEKRKTGSLYAVVDLDKSPVDETKWFTVRIVVDGKRITVALDGKQVVDYTEPTDVVRPKDRAGRLLSADGGGIALQAHDAKSVWYFKDIRVKRLP